MADGIWKLRYSHCMWKVPVTIHGFGKINYPSVCPLSPKRGQAFCEAHCGKANQLGIPTELRKFYRSCGVSGASVDEGLFSAILIILNVYLKLIYQCKISLYCIALEVMSSEAVLPGTVKNETF